MTDDADDADDEADATTDGENPRGTVYEILTVGLAVALALSVVGVVYVAVTPQQTGDTFTEFYVVSPGGNASGYPTNLTTGESGDVVVGVTNHERRDLDYRVEITWNGTTTQERRITVPRGETREIPVTLTAPEEPGRYRVNVNLYVDNGTDRRYRYLRLFVHVRDEE